MFGRSPNTFNYFSKLMDGYKVMKTTSGGRRMSFCAVVVTGNGKGLVGFGIGKAKEMPDAVNKATEAAKKDMISIPMRNWQLGHKLDINVNGNRVVIKNGRPGSDVVCASVFRVVFNLLGLKDITCKYYGSSQVHVQLRDLFDALKSYSKRFEVYKALKVKQVAQ